MSNTLPNCTLLGFQIFIILLVTGALLSLPKPQAPKLCSSRWSDYHSITTGAESASCDSLKPLTKTGTRQISLIFLSEGHWQSLCNRNLLSFEAFFERWYRVIPPLVQSASYRRATWSQSIRKTVGLFYTRTNYFLIDLSASSIASVALNFIDVYPSRSFPHPITLSV